MEKFKINLSWHSSFVSFTLDAEEIERQIAQVQAYLNDYRNELKNVINYSIRGDDTREKSPAFKQSDLILISLTLDCSNRNEMRVSVDK